MATSTFLPEAAAPGIFTDQNFAPVPGSRGSPGQIITLFITGGGALTVPVATGAAPAAGTPLGNLPRSSQSLSVTVGGISAPVVFAGIPEGLVGVVQVNYQIPDGVVPGVNPVAVQVGSSSSAPAMLTVE